MLKLGFKIGKIINILYSFTRFKFEPKSVLKIYADYLYSTEILLVFIIMKSRFDLDSRNTGGLK